MMEAATEVKEHSYSVGGIRIDAMQHHELAARIEEARLAQEKLLILNHNLHSLYLYLSDPAFAATYAGASYVYIDGMPVVWLCQLAGLPISARHRITFLDSFNTLLREATHKGWRIFYLGSTEEVIREGLSILRKMHPGLMISGRNGFFEKRGRESDDVISAINSFSPDVLFVGMGMPVQELWISENLDKLRASSILTCGATLNYITGHMYKPPAWAGPLALYGAFRLLAHPKRLWRRYLLEPPILARQLVPRIVMQRMLQSKSGTSI
jgi:N-acetylglucosaminyldiphosphoundecaprenol N-acetyl-beta-D-mannosaminyltransferase